MIAHILRTGKCAVLPASASKGVPGERWPSLPRPSDRVLAHLRAHCGARKAFLARPAGPHAANRWPAAAGHDGSWLRCASRLCSPPASDILRCGLFFVIYSQADVVIRALSVDERTLGWHGAADQLLRAALSILTIFIAVVFPAFSRLIAGGAHWLPAPTRQTWDPLLILAILISLGRFVRAPGGEAGRHAPYGNWRWEAVEAPSAEAPSAEASSAEASSAAVDWAGPGREAGKR